MSGWNSADWRAYWVEMRFLLISCRLRHLGTVYWSVCVRNRETSRLRCRIRSNVLNVACGQEIWHDAESANLCWLLLRACAHMHTIRSYKYVALKIEFRKKYCNITCVNYRVKNLICYYLLYLVLHLFHIH